MNFIGSKIIQIADSSRYPDLSLIYIKEFLNAKESLKLFQLLKDGTEWQSAYVTIYGKKYLQPRLSAWIADPSVQYTYSGLTLPRNDWTTGLLDLKKRISDLIVDEKTRFNSVLLNYYRNGNDSMGWHQDNEKVLGVYPVIASVSLGCERVFKMKHINSERKTVINFNLSAGDLLLMKGATQEFWSHSLPKTSKPAGGRINLTFRHIKYDA